MIEQQEREEEVTQGEETQQPAVTEDKPLTVDLSEEAEEESPQQQTPERIRHKSDWRKMKESHAAEMAELRKELAEMKGRLSAPQYQPQQPPRQQPAADPDEAEIQSLSRQQDFMLKAINAGGLSDQDQQIAVEEWRKLDRRRRALESKKDNPQSQQQTPHLANEDQMIAQLIRIEFPHVFDDDELRTRAEAEMLGLMKRGRAKSLATAREACQRVSKRTGLFGKPPEPTNAERARYSSVSSRAGTNGGSGDHYTPSKQVLELARSWSSHEPDLSDAERVRRWVKAVGKPNGLV